MAWAPQAGPQKALIDCPLSDILFGGARGGGKTDGILGKYALKGLKYGAAFNAAFFRKEMPQQDDLIERAREIYSAIDAEWYEQKKLFRLPGGGRIRFRPLENVADAEKYQGQNLTDAAVEEAGNYTTSAPIDRLFGCLRSVGGVPIQLVLTANPGGAGHHWISERYINPAPMGMKILRRDLPNGAVHKYTYIPSKVQNNRILLANDPGYVNRLYLVGSEALVKAWLQGDWSVIEGAFFDCWSVDKHVIRPCVLPDHWTRFRSMDWGSARPFSVGWWAIASEAFITPDNRVIPRGAMVRYREWYGSSGPNKGLKMFAEDVARGIKERELGDKIEYGTADPAIFAQDGGPSIAERMGTQQVYWQAADNKRVTQYGHMGGWDQMRARLVGEDDRPMIYCFSTCTDSIRTIPVLQHDKNKPEDVDSEGEDHAADEWRYGCMSRPYTAPTPQPVQPIEHTPPTFNDLLKLSRDRRDRN